MDELFSCRNCVHNAAQTLVIGVGVGYCLIHRSVLKDAATTTCKYLRRKDLPSFVVDEGVREHAYEFATSSGIVDIDTMETIRKVNYSEKHAWLTDSFDPLTLTLAHAHNIRPTRAFIETMAGGLDGRRSLVHGSFVRRYMANCDTWISSYRLVLALVQAFQEPATFSTKDLVDGAASLEDASWDLFFVRISGVQEYGFHSGLEELMWATDALGEAFAELDWVRVQASITETSTTWKDLILRHAKDQGEFFPAPAVEDNEGDVDAL